MSFKLTALVLDFGPSDTASRMLLMALGDRADKAGICWPSRADLCERTCMSDSTITRRLRKLERDGWLQRSQRFQRSNVFRLNVARLYAAQAQAALKPDIPEGFEPFEEELGSVQPVDISDNGQGDPRSGQPDLKNGQSDPLTYKKPIKNEMASLMVLSQTKWDEYLRDRLPGENRQAWLFRTSGVRV